MSLVFRRQSPITRIPNQISQSSGALIAGQSASISGSGFGSTAPVIMAWDTFESGTNGATVANPEVGAAYNTGITQPTYTTSLSHSGTKCAFGNPQSGDQFNPISVALNLSSTLKLYAHCWFRRSAYSQDGALKMMTIEGSDTQADVSPGYRAGGFVGDWWGSYISRDPDGDQTGQVSNIDLIAQDTWTQVEFIGLQSSGASTLDADVRLYFDRALEYQRTGGYTRTTTTRRWGTFEIMSGATNFATYPDLFVDELLVQHNWSRVMLCNNSTFATSTLRVPQLVTSWTNTAIAYTVFKGALSSGTVYEVVIDDTDTVVKTTARTLS